MRALLILMPLVLLAPPGICPCLFARTLDIGRGPCIASPWGTAVARADDERSAQDHDREVEVPDPGLVAHLMDLAFVEHPLLRSAWRALFLHYPDRFLLGTDTWTNERWWELPAIVQDSRRWLVDLPLEVAEKIMNGNGERLFPTEHGLWKDRPWCLSDRPFLQE